MRRLTFEAGSLTCFDVGSERGTAWKGAWVSTLLIVAAVLSACSPGSPSSTAPIAAPVASSAGASPGPACAGTAGTVTLTIPSGGVSRTVIAHAPTVVAGGSPVPLVLNLHGSGSTAAEQEAFSALDATADADGFIVAYPQGAIPDGTGDDWNVPGQPLIGGKAVPAGAADDVAFLTQTVSILEQRYCVDPRRVYATGFSGGARLASQLACDRSSLVAAIAPVSGLRLPEPCASARPVPVISFHGTSDPVDPYNGQGQAYWTYGVPEAAQRWAAHDSCGSTPQVTTAGDGVQLTSYPGCASGAAVELYSITGAGHTWSGGPHLPASLTAVLGPQSNSINANALIWTFFQEHPLR